MKLAQTAFRSEDVFTQREFRRWLGDLPPSNINHYELLDGRIVMTPPAGWTHGSIGNRIGVRIGQHVQEQRLGIVFDSSAGYELPSGDTLEPDVSFVSTKRFATQPPRTPNQFLRMAPTLVIEILSPSTARRDQTEKKDIYARNGVDEYWIVDPAKKIVTVFHLTRRRYGAGRSFKTGRIRSRVLPQVDLSAEDVFSL
ncbi:MAG: Uma2 family endonuclease [Deltaproteobacteria bacterium]|nr:Uma2 family endonuclease [Deltaproteobacteria bacterium]MBI3387212.1 Uma2 family endonuclease [Deltaproteobacteria bacterium]